MNDFFYAIGDLFTALFPVIKAVGRFVNTFWILALFIGTCGWLVWMEKHPDQQEKFD